jgi:glutamate decarboxylase
LPSTSLLITTNIYADVQLPQSRCVSLSPLRPRFLTPAKGFEGYRRIAIKDLRNARMLSRALEATYFTLLSNIHKPSKDGAAILKNATDDTDTDDPELYERGLPVVAFRLSDKFMKEYPHVQQAWVQSMLRTKGWIVPNYNAPEGEAQTEILRVVGACFLFLH